MTSPTYLLAVDFRAIGLTVAALVLIAFVVLFVRNIAKAKPELGSEMELAANRKEYLSDEELEGTKLDRSLSFALVMLALLAISLPFYWLAEPGRQEGSTNFFENAFEVRGERQYAEGSGCVDCHAAGGVGGTAAYVLQDADGQFLANAEWKAPSLNDVLLRYDESEVTYILDFGRPGSPMAAWGTAGGGPRTTQQVETIIAYLDSIQVQSLDPIDIAEAGTSDTDDIESQEAQLAADEQEAVIRAEVDRSIAAGEFETIGEAVFNLGLYSGFAGGGLSCGRCHTAGWSLGPDLNPDLLEPGIAGCGGGNPSGIGFNLCGSSLESHFPDDTWKAADGSWLPAGGLADDQGFYLEALDGSQIRLDDNSNPVTDDGESYLILGPMLPDGTENPDQDGDLADCAFVSGLWEPEVGPAYPFDPEVGIQVDENGDFVDPDPITLADVPGGPDATVVLEDGRLGGDCRIVEMPERTSQAQYEFIYNGAEAGEGYGRGGQSTAGMMPGFGRVLPPDYIQAVVDYERGL